MSNFNPIITATDLSVGYGNKPILKDINFSIYPGDMICLMGHNGCGKTTLLRSMSKLLNHIGGEILVKDQSIYNYNENNYAKILSVVLTERMGNLRLTVRELVELGRFPYTGMMGILSYKDKKIINDALEHLGIVELQNKKLFELSDGQRQKAFIARALSQDSEILLLDEPTTFLDLPGKMEILKLLKTIAVEKKVAVLFSSHDWQLILELVSWIWLISDTGKLGAGIPEDFIINGEFEKCFSHRDFSFDKDRGFFKENREMISKVSLSGESDKCRIWTEHLLRKESFEVVAGKSPSISHVNITNDGWEITKNSKCLRVNTLEELLVKLR